MELYSRNSIRPSVQIVNRGLTRKPSPVLGLQKNSHLESTASIGEDFSLEEPSVWPGLNDWRKSPQRKDYVWNPGKAVQSFPKFSDHISKKISKAELPNSLAECGRLVLSTAEPMEKATLTHAIFEEWISGNLPVGFSEPPERPSRPSKPELVHPRSVPQPGRGSPLPPNAHILHTVAHVELNAVDLAWDTAVRYSRIQEDLGGDLFFGDFVRVAEEEARHLGWCLQRLEELGFCYGDLPAHNLLWKDCSKTSGSVFSRLAIIPMVQEARGLDAGPRCVEKLLSLGDNRTAEILEKISEEELAHVAVGVYWFLNLCGKLNKEPSRSFKGYLKEFGADSVKGPFNYEARKLAGLPRHWYDPPAQDSKNSFKEELQNKSKRGLISEQRQLRKKAMRISSRLESFQETLQNEAFLAKAPVEVIESVKEQKHSTKKALESVHERLALVLAVEEDRIAD